jgi:hypothetical protein
MYPKYIKCDFCITWNYGYERTRRAKADVSTSSTEISCDRFGVWDVNGRRVYACSKDLVALGKGKEQLF